MTDPYKVINYEGYDFEKSTIIKPKTHNFDEEHRVPSKTTDVVINSTDRKRQSYPKPSDYVIELYDEVQDVMSVELKVAVLPYNPYNITANNNKLYIGAVGDSPTTVTLPVGTYGGGDIAFALTYQINQVITDMVVTYSAITQHFVFTAPTVFYIATSTDDVNYDKHDMSKLLGLPPQQACTAVPDAIGSFVLESTYAADFVPANTIVMNIDAMSVKVSPNNIFNKAFGIIPQSINDFTMGDVYSIKKYFNPPLARIDKLRIRFSDVHGKPYDFQNKDHLLEFAFTSHKNIRKYHAYVA